MVTRLVCNHQYHEICWDSYQHMYDADSHECPNCRGPGTAKACYQHLGAHNPNEVRPRRRNHSRGADSSGRPRFLPGATPTSSESSFLEVTEDVQHVYMTTDAMADAAAAASQWDSGTAAAAAASQGLTVEQWSEWLGSWSSMSPQDVLTNKYQTTGQMAHLQDLATLRVCTSNKPAGLRSQARTPS